MYPSETSKHRTLLQSYCTGFGCDIGFGGDPINENAIRVDLPQPYAKTGHASVQLGGDCRDLKWFRDDVLDFVYSSHVLEDFAEDTTALILREWARVLRVGGRVVLLLPDQQRYLRHCEISGQPVNPYHAIPHFSLKYIRDVTEKIPQLRFIAGKDIDGDYSFFAVLEKTAPFGEEESATLGIRRALESALEHNRRLHEENIELKAKVDRIRANPFFARLLRLRAALRCTFQSR